jgi:hypothetical protein
VLHPAIELRFVNPEVGYGVFAVEDIPMGTITWALDPLDQIIGPARAEDVDALLPRELRRYSWLNGQGDRILCWDFGRYMNHSCEPNSVGPGILEMEVAVRDIVAGEEVTCDYGTFNLEEPMPCSCGTPSCRGTVAREDAPRIVPRLDRRVRRAFAHLKQVDQPLWGLVQRWRLEIERGLARPAHLPSLLENRWPRAGEGVSLPRARAGA